MWPTFPNGRVIGLSKIPRLVDIFARRLQLQERMTNQIAETIREKIDAARRGGRLRGHPPLHGDARRREAELLHGHQRHARRLPRSRPHADGVPRAAQAAQPEPDAGRRCRFLRRSHTSTTEQLLRSSRSARRSRMDVPDTEACVRSRWFLSRWSDRRRPSGVRRRNPRRRKRPRRRSHAAKAAPAPALTRIQAEVTCPSELGIGVETKRRFCDVLAGRDPAAGVLVTIPPHRGPVTL